jgi:hypothetical protein
MSQSIQLSTLLWRSYGKVYHGLCPLSKILVGKRAQPVLLSLIPWLPISITTSTSSRRWFTIQSNQLVYQKKYKVGKDLAGWALGRLSPCLWLDSGCLITFSCQDPVTVVVDDLRLCTVKLCPDSERRFCFEVVSTSK